MPRMTVKLLLVDVEDRVLMIHGSDPRTGSECWYPVGGGVEDGESLQQAAAREAHEETGLTELPVGTPVWTRDHTYEHDGRTAQVHEDRLLLAVRHFEPAPAHLSDLREHQHHRLPLVASPGAVRDDRHGLPAHARRSAGISPARRSSRRTARHHRVTERRSVAG